MPLIGIHIENFYSPHSGSNKLLIEKKLEKNWCTTRKNVRPSVVESIREVHYMPGDWKRDTWQPNTRQQLSRGGHRETCLNVRVSVHWRFFCYKRYYCICQSNCVLRHQCETSTWRHEAAHLAAVVGGWCSCCRRRRCWRLTGHVMEACIGLELLESSMATSSSSLLLLLLSSRGCRDSVYDCRQNVADSSQNCKRRCRIRTSRTICLSFSIFGFFVYRTTLLKRTHTPPFDLVPCCYVSRSQRPQIHCKHSTTAGYRLVGCSIRRGGGLQKGRRL